MASLSDDKVVVNAMAAVVVAKMYGTRLPVALASFNV
jgi:hypothetical protein